MSEHAAMPRRKVFVLAAITIVLVLIAAIGVPIYLAKYGTSQAQKKEQAQAGQAAEQAAKKDLATQVDEACAAGGVVAKNLTQRGLCGRAKEIIQEPVRGERGEPGPPPTDAQVQRAVDAYCASGRCNGKSPTVQQVAAAVAAYCNARGQCTPPKPKDGKPGEPGKNATSEQVAAAVASFCADGACDGEDGANGRGVAISTAAIAGGTRVTVSYSDDTPSASFDVMDGKDGAPSTVPGPPGPMGPPGPACPADATLQKKMVITTEEPTGLLVAVCVMNDQG